MQLKTCKVNKMSISNAESDTSSFVQREHDTINNVLKLKLKKPKSWNWELSTSKSSPHICFPRILLYDDKNSLLAVTNEANTVINGASGCQRNVNNVRHSISSNSVVKKPKRIKSGASNGLSGDGSSDRAHIINSTELIDCSYASPPSVPSISRSESSRSRKCKRSVSISSCDIIEILDEFVSDLKSQGINCNVRRRSSSSASNRKSVEVPEDMYEVADPITISEIDDIVENGVQPEIPILVYSERGILRRDLNAKEFQSIRNRDKASNAEVATLPARHKSPVSKSEAIGEGGLQKSRSALEVPTFSRDNHPVEQKRTRRKLSAKSAAIDSSSYLERLSQFKRRTSSTDSQAIDDSVPMNETDDVDKPKYSLQSSPAGTLVVREESFRNRKVRRRSRKCSNIYEEEEPMIRPEKVVHKYVYNGGMSNPNAPLTPSGRRTFDRNLLERKGESTDTYNHTDKFASRYEKEIASIDCLISKVISLQTDSKVDKIGQLNNISHSASVKSESNATTTTANDDLCVDNSPSSSLANYTNRNGKVASESNSCGGVNVHDHASLDIVECGKLNNENGSRRTRLRRRSFNRFETSSSSDGDDKLSSDKKKEAFRSRKKKPIMTNGKYIIWRLRQQFSEIIVFVEVPFFFAIIHIIHILQGMRMIILCCMKKI